MSQPVSRALSGAGTGIPASSREVLAAHGRTRSTHPVPETKLVQGSAVGR